MKVPTLISFFHPYQLLSQGAGLSRILLESNINFGVIETDFWINMPDFKAQISSISFIRYLHTLNCAIQVGVQGVIQYKWELLQSSLVSLSHCRKFDESSVDINFYTP